MISAFLWGLLASSILVAEPVYRCQINGKTTFTDNPSGSSCEKVEIKVRQPDPIEAQRLEQARRDAAKREADNQEQAEKKRLMNAQIAAANAARLTAEAQRRLAEQMAIEQQMQNSFDSEYGYYGNGIYGYGIQTPVPYPLPYPGPYYPQGQNSQYPQRPIRPSTPNYPYRHDQIAPNARGIR